MSEFNFLDYERKERQRLQKIFGGGGLGISVGAVLCALSLFTGTAISWPEVLVIISGLAILGATTGFITS